MGWPYEILDLSHEEKLARRQSLDLYACIAHYSALVPAIVFLAYRLSRRVAVFVAGRAPSSSQQGHRYAAVPSSPVVKAHRESSAGNLETRWRKLAWWLGDDVYFAGGRSHWGQRDEWILGALWTVWLLVLSFKGTGKDYFHLTKRFGIVAVSQLPIQYLLSLKSLNPFAWVFRSSHEHVNRYHRVLGRIIYGLLLVHLVLYNAFFLKAGIWLTRILNPVVLTGLLASLGFHGMTATAMRTVRAYSYRVFFVVHVAVAVVTPVLLFFHAASARIYLVEALVVFVVDLAVRRLATINAPSTLESIPGTGLVKAALSVPLHSLAAFRALPGTHLYLNIPPSSRTTAVPSSKSPIFNMLFNPFTVAAVDDRHGTVTIVARVRHGPMTNTIRDFASTTTTPPEQTSSAADDTQSRKITLSIQGPYGTMSSHFPDLVSWAPTRVLLVAGGVGATFALPVYHALQTECPSAKLHLVWAVREAADATWAVSSSSSNEGKSVLDDANIHLFLTGEMGVSSHGRDNNNDAVEMTQLRRDDGRISANQSRKRPNFEKIVDDTFRHGVDDSVAVLVCGPAQMARDVRSRVRVWVMRGRRVWWHNETFGW